MLSNTCKYAIRAVIYLAIHHEENKRIGIKEISAELDIPTPFLGKILQTLAKHKMLLSTKGPNGGFAIGKNIADITLLDIVEIIDGLDVFKTCLIGHHTCKSNHDDDKKCPVHDKFHLIRTQLYDLFKSETIEKIVLGANSNLDIIRL
jgi:Rrf2 family transcriptional regulator, iron-sulfur cluster assembly transcription factor